MIPLLIGTFVFGFRLVQSQQLDQITRDLAHMYSRGIDFTTSGGASEAESLADQFGLTATGQCALFFSTITLETSAACQAATGQTTCTNINQAVFTQQVGIGNVTSNASVFGTPSSTGSLPATSGVSNDYSSNPTAVQQATDTWAVANGFNNVLNLSSGQTVYVVEMYDNTPALSVGGITGKPLVYSRAIF
jgi:hypothetical protein